MISFKRPPPQTNIHLHLSNSCFIHNTRIDYSIIADVSIGFVYGSKTACLDWVSVIMQIARKHQRLTTIDRSGKRLFDRDSKSKGFTEEDRNFDIVYNSLCWLL